MWFAIPLALALIQQTYYVDDDGAGDFLDLPAAVAATAPGDILLVAPGTYSPTTISHDLTVLASAKWVRPLVAGGALVITGASDVTLAGLELRDLEVTGVTGRVRVDDCALGWGSSSTGLPGAVTITDSSVVVITRSALQAPSPEHFWGEAALRLTDSDVVAVDCSLVGSDGLDDPIDPDPGWPAVRSYGASSLHLAGTSVSGGYGGGGIMGGMPDGYAIEEASGALDLVIQGSSIHTVSGNLDGLDLWNGTVRWSGVTFPTPPWQWPETVPAEPYLLLGGKDQPGAARRIQAYGAAGEVLLAYFSAAPTSASLPGVAGAPLLVSPADLFLVRATVLLGQEIPATVSLPLPADPTLIGFVVDAQALVLTAAGPFLTNPHQVALRP